MSSFSSYPSSWVPFDLARHKTSPRFLSAAPRLPQRLSTGRADHKSSIRGGLDLACTPPTTTPSALWDLLWASGRALWVFDGQERKSELSTTDPGRCTSVRQGGRVTALHMGPHISLLHCSWAQYGPFSTGKTTVLATRNQPKKHLSLSYLRPERKSNPREHLRVKGPNSELRYGTLCLVYVHWKRLAGKCGV